jgi:hypothetical protein
MKNWKLVMLLMMMVLATACWASTRNWKEAMVINVTETDVSGQLKVPTNTMHYTIETADTVYNADYSWKPGQRNATGAPNIAVNEPTKVAIEGKNVYILDASGKEVKLHIVGKAKKK